MKRLKPIAIGLPIIWLVGLYLAWVDYEDCPKALGQIGNSDPELYNSLLVECSTASDRVTIVAALGIVALIPALVLTIIFWRRSSGR